MLLLRDPAQRQDAAERLDSHTALIHRTWQGQDPADRYGAKLATTLAAAVRSPMYAGTLTGELAERLRSDTPLPPAEALDAFAALPFLGKKEFGGHGAGAFTRPLSEFLHYYESSGTTGDPAPAPKAVDDLLVNTLNIGETWGRLLQPADVALILINAPFAPAAYQFEKVLEYLGVMSFRPWVDNITGDYTRVLRLISELNANVYVGPPSRLLELAQFSQLSGLPLPRFDRLLLMAEQTGPSFLRHLERLTGGTAYVGSYGSSETGTLAVTCEHRRLHLQLQSYLLEIDDGERTTVLGPGGEPVQGELIVTTLDIPSRPLLRYRTGDLVRIETDPCDCGIRLPVLRTLGRAQDVLLLAQNNIRQDDLEEALWAEALPGASVFNYMLVLRGKTIVCLVTTDGTPDGSWSEVLEQRLAPLFEEYTVTVHPVEKLPPLASLGQYLGWKLSRVLDLNEEANWGRLPAPLTSLVRESLAQVAQATGVQA
ncbi:hypothetical protein [Kitasatospora sp. NPDC093102]|uniref:phenylacetate--CoA ligase family protein n=1 Tax=Kitasatospora sp. NPDC093102 TaxID=3155069 RepID=UPI0034467D7C